ncbi:MAG TPA: tRNA (adenosine(37)-N6)-threonylcarbamoyltransferase complex dimerization subunit type 1 TsaB [Melioribacteraceae bacterium]|nr:tRNA (adenosine(37)-N6)-threonylcarbamoyltransferase complex dimerization subunit type 1 TsaB [Melioribacteraceae bacterium]
MKTNFPILGIETSGELCSVALMVNDSEYYEVNILKKHIHSRKLIDMIDSVLKESGTDIKKISSIAVSMGPGSFTGLRIGLTAAKGLAFGSQLPVIPVSTFNAMAVVISGFLKPETEFAVMRNASIEDLYFSEFVSEGISFRTLKETCLVNKKDLEQLLSGKDLIFGDLTENFPVKRFRGPEAVDICRYAYLFGKDLLTFDYDYLEPYYLKQFIARVKK